MAPPTINSGTCIQEHPVSASYSPVNDSSRLSSPANSSNALPVLENREWFTLERHVLVFSTPELHSRPQSQFSQGFYNTATQVPKNTPIQAHKSTLTGRQLLPLRRKTSESESEGNFALDQRNTAVNHFSSEQVNRRSATDEIDSDLQRLYEYHNSQPRMQPVKTLEQSRTRGRYRDTLSERSLLAMLQQQRERMGSDVQHDDGFRGPHLGGPLPFQQRRD